MPFWLLPVTVQNISNRYCNIHYYHVSLHTEYFINILFSDVLSGRILSTEIVSQLIVPPGRIYNSADLLCATNM